MKLATRINSFFNKTKDINSVFENIKKIGVDYVDLNYPEHFENYTLDEIKEYLEKNDLKLNGIALRFKNKFINGSLLNIDDNLQNDAITICREAVDYCEKLGGKVVTIWLGYDGFDYSFQTNYEKIWKKMIESYTEICEYNKNMRISIEYKPFQPRAYSFIDSFGITGMILNDVNRENLGVTLDYCHMLMKHENPAFATAILSERNKLYGIHLNDGYGLNDDGLMVGTSTPFKTLEMLYYLKKYNYDDVIYFDTFPVIEDAVKECECNIRMIKCFDKMIDDIGLDFIQSIIDENDAIKANELMYKFFNIK